MSSSPTSRELRAPASAERGVVAGDVQAAALPSSRPALGATGLRWALLVAASALIFAAYLLSYPRDPSNELVFTSPRENVGYLLTERAVAGEGFEYPLAYFDELPEDVRLGLVPRDAAVTDGNVTPKDFPGTMLLHAAAMLISPTLILVISPLLGLTAALIAAEIGKKVFGLDLGVIPILFVASLPPLWINSSYIFMGDIAALVAVLAAVYFLVTYWESERWQDLGLVSVALAVSILFRYPNVLLVLPLAAALIVGGRFRPTHVAAAGLLALPVGLIALGFNYLVYGNATTTGFAIGTDILNQTANISGEAIAKFRPEIAWSYVENYAFAIGGPTLVEIHVPALPFLLGLAIALPFVLKRGSAAQGLAVFTVGTVATFGFYYGNQDAWGLDNTWVNASILRYLLPAIVLTAVFFVFQLMRWTKDNGFHPVVGVAVLVVLLLANVQHTLDGNAGIRGSYESVESFRDIRREVFASTEPNAIIATRQLDKILFPERQTLTLTYVLNNEEPVDKGNLQTWELVPDPERFSEVADSVVSRGIPFYLLADRFITPIEDYRAALNRSGLVLSRVTSVESAPLYRIVRSGGAGGG